ncbi:hypothetical protein BU26DRAFT_453066 [Trematosphaeria pertusa]|uniref:NADH-ubiquinone oxidoreductase 213 kDa subunit n=1 Tax=Trematosphaeria pertusa TaxID=390896 RepID=A0A6A6IQH3_9PLEO|nr:uncharacterized protein BU26DRAFT_453066 [Trematosphaeria pertusa]KAF2252646.1 hypothetical protein BU26DRAFT_453066 [Trematosphaeria pertusa]
MADEHETFHPRDTLANTASTTLKLTACGAIFAGVQNTLRKQNVGAMGIFTRSGGIIALYAGVGATYQFTKDATSNLRQKDDCYSEALAGFVGGATLGVAKRSIPYMLGAGACFGTAMAAFRYTNGLSGFRQIETDEDEVERKEMLRKMRRRPLQETIEQLGEGRGIYAPGYEERRRERLLAKYGIDVAAAQETFKKDNVDPTVSL